MKYVTDAALLITLLLGPLVKHTQAISFSCKVNFDSGLDPREFLITSNHHQYYLVVHQLTLHLGR